MDRNEPAGPWLVRHQASPRARVRLFCFPYAGGTAHVYRQWPRGLPESVEVWGVQPPGRGGRLREKPFTSLDELVAAATPALRPLTALPFAFFGHSMGAMIAFELARRLCEEGAATPERLFLSGCRAPQFAHTRAITYDLPEPEFVEELRRLRGTPAEVLDNQELLQLMLPLLRADFAITQTYRYREGPPLACPFTVFGGLEDEDVRPESLPPWREHTSGEFSLHMLPGGHFFLHTAQAALLETIAGQLRRPAGGAA